MFNLIDENMDEKMNAVRDLENVIFIKPHEQFQFVENPLAKAVLTVGFTYPTEYLPDKCKPISVK